MGKSRLIALIVIFLAASPALSESGKPVKLKRIPIPEKEHGYNQFKSTLFDSQEELATFLIKTTKQEHWNNSGAFIHALKNSKVDFRSDCLLLVRSTVGSGSIGVSLADPRIVNDELICEIEWKLPKGLYTADMVYRCYALVVPKGIVKQIRIVSRGSRDPAVITMPKQ
jgi:hypothetical protein